MSGYLLVRSNGSALGLLLEDVLEVVDTPHILAIPGSKAAVRGVTNHRDRMITVAHLSALLHDAIPPDEIGRTAVVVSCLGIPVAFEVDDAEEVVRGDPLPVPPGRRLPWASGIAQHGDEVVPVVDMNAAGGRLKSYAEGVVHAR